MSVHNTIVLSAPATGRFIEGFIFGTPKPGICVTIKAGVQPVGGRLTWEPFNRDADANRAPIAVLREMQLMGKGPEDAYVTGERCLLYFPIPGDELKMRVAAPGTGTSDNYEIGQYFIVDDGTGNLIATTGSPEAEPFQAMEDIADVVSTGTLVHVMFTGY